MTVLDPSTERPPVGSRRLLALVGAAPTALDEHRLAYGAPVGEGPRLDLIDEVERAGLRGRGGAAFPTAVKLRSVLAARETPVVVVNGAEGEPLSHKDSLLARRVPHLVLDGAALAASMVGATEVHVALDRAEREAVVNVDHAILARRSAAEARSTSTYVRPIPSHYVAGEETALIRHLDGGPALPTARRTRPFESGLAGRPTLVLNVETAAHLAQIVRWGAGWFRQEGTSAHPGTCLVTVAGGVVHPGVYEVSLGVPLATLASAAGGLTARPQAVLVGGYFGSWLPGAEVAGVGLSNEQLLPFGAAVGSAAVFFLPEGLCGLHASARVMTWLAGQTAGQCGPCVHGLAAIAGALRELADGGADDQVVARLARWAGQVDGRGACRFPDGAVRFLRSSLHVFADDARRHRAGLVCPRPDGPVLPTPAIEVER